MSGSAGRPSTDPDAQRQRADAYVMGRMRAAEREQAESDLETDQAFRDEVLAAAHRLGQVPDAHGDGTSPVGWEAIAAHLRTLPHMQPRSGLEVLRAPRAETQTVEGLDAASSPLSHMARALRETLKTLLALLRPSQ